MKKLKYKEIKFKVPRIIFGLIALSIFFSQIYTAFGMIGYNMGYQRRMIDHSDLDRLFQGEKVTGTFSKNDFVTVFKEEPEPYHVVDYYIYLTPAKKLFAVVTDEYDTGDQAENLRLAMTEDDYFLDEYEIDGIVEDTTPELRKKLKSSIPKDVFTKYEITGDDISVNYILLICENSTYDDYNIYPIILRGLVALAAAIVLFYPFISNLRYNRLVRKGVIIPEREITLADVASGEDARIRAQNIPKDDTPIEYYQGGVNEKGNFSDETEDDSGS